LSRFVACPPKVVPSVKLVVVQTERNVEYALTDHTHTDGTEVTDTLYVYDTLIVNYDTTIFVIDTVYINSIDCAGVIGGTA